MNKIIMLLLKNISTGVLGFILGSISAAILWLITGNCGVGLPQDFKCTKQQAITQEYPQQFECVQWTKPTQHFRLDEK